MSLADINEGETEYPCLKCGTLYHKTVTADEVTDGSWVGVTHFTCPKCGRVAWAKYENGEELPEEDDD